MKFRVYIAGIVTILAAFIIVILSACIVDIKAASKDEQQTIQISPDSNVSSGDISDAAQADSAVDSVDPGLNNAGLDGSDSNTTDSASGDAALTEEAAYPELHDSYNALVEKYNSIVTACQEASLTEDDVVKEVLTQAAEIITEIGNTDLETAEEDDIADLTESIDLMMILLDQIIERAELKIDDGIVANYEKPDFTVTTSGGEQFTLSEQGGSTVVLSFFATWCNPCKEELAILQELKDDDNYSDVKFIAICSGSDNTATAKFLKNNNLTLMAAGDPDGSISADYNVSAIPYTLVFDGTGAVVAEFEGLYSVDDYKAAIGK